MKYMITVLQENLQTVAHNRCHMVNELRIEVLQDNQAIITLDNH